MRPGVDGKSAAAIIRTVRLLLQKIIRYMSIIERMLNIDVDSHICMTMVLLDVIFSDSDSLECKILSI